MLADLAGAHGGVRRVRILLEARGLDSPGGDHAAADGFGLFACVGAGGKLTEIHQWHLDVHVDAIKERVGNFLAVVLDLPRGAAALALRIAVVAAGVWVPF